MEDRTDGAAEQSATPQADLVAQARANRPVRKGGADVAPKAAPTPKRRGATAKPKQRTTPAEFVNQSVGELKKVHWPTGTQVQQYFWVVLAFVLFIMAFVTLLDLGFGALLLKLFG